MRRADGPTFLPALRERPCAVAVFIVGCTLFLLIRLAVICSAPDRLTDVTWAEYQIPDKADGWLGRECLGRAHLPHLWGSEITAAALVPFLAVGFTEAQSVRLLPLLLSFGLFASAVYLLAWRLGALPAAVLAALLIFPDREYLTWSLVTWGPYQESHHLTFLALFVWVYALHRNTPGWLTAAGAVVGLTVAFSYGTAYLAGAMLVLTPLAATPRPTARALVLFYVAGALAVVPRLIWLQGGAWSAPDQVDFLEYHVPQSGFLAVPTVGHLSQFLRRLQGLTFFRGIPNGVLAKAGLLWLAAAFWLPRRRAERWLGTMPLGFVLCVVMFLFFPRPLIDVLQMRHVIGLVPIVYVAIACLVGETLLPGAWVGPRPWLRPAEWFVKFALLLALVVANARGVVGLVQFGQMGMFAKFRGMDYARLDLRVLRGAEVDRVNCLLDQRPALDQENPAFARGLGPVFAPPNEPRVPPLHFEMFVPPSPKFDPAEYYRGVGCAMALKNGVPASAVERVPTHAFADAPAAAREGYEYCRSLPCMPPPTARGTDGHQEDE